MLQQMILDVVVVVLQVNNQYTEEIVTEVYL